MQRFDVDALDPGTGNAGKVPTVNAAGDAFELATPTGGGGGLTEEDVRDIVGALLHEGANVTIAVDDAGDSITIAAKNPWLVIDNGAAVPSGTAPNTIIFERA